MMITGRNVMMLVTIFSATFSIGFIGMHLWRGMPVPSTFIVLLITSLSGLFLMGLTHMGRKQDS